MGGPLRGAGAAAAGAGVIITTTRLAPACVLDLAAADDERGRFTRAFCAAAFAAHGLPERFVQTSVSRTTRRGTLRGLHWQAGAAAEGKLVCCVAGAVFDVMIDLRPDQPTYRAWLGFELSAANRRAVYVPPGFAHGMQALTDDAVLLYQMTAPWCAGQARGARWNDPAFAIAWPIADPVLSVADAGWPDFPGPGFPGSDFPGSDFPGPDFREAVPKDAPDHIPACAID